MYFGYGQSPGKITMWEKICCFQPLNKQIYDCWLELVVLWFKGAFDSYTVIPVHLKFQHGLPTNKNNMFLFSKR